MLPEGTYLVGELDGSFLGIGSLACFQEGYSLPVLYENSLQPYQFLDITGLSRGAGLEEFFSALRQELVLHPRLIVAD